MNRRKRRYPLELFARAVEIAAATSAHNAARATGLSARTVRKEMRRGGVAPRRPGNYTQAEINRVAGKLVGL
jgi:hypothetical protein